jgi:2-polyprenyl-6-methoxyphenol hydroxylase-like FAD-dependent oxidoreductase
MAPSIAILGAGPAGLTLASLFHKKNIRFAIYDLRAAPSADLLSLPSGSLDLHEESGLLALEACGLTAAFEKLPGVCTEQMLITGKDGVLKYQDDGHGGSRPEVPRNDLLHLLLSSIPPSSVNWEHKVLSCAPSPVSKGRWTLTFEDREPATFDLVIGADGAWSRVRPAVADVRPHYSGVHCITLTIPHVSRYPALDELVGTGSFWALGANKTIMSHRGSLDSARMYLMISAPSAADLDLNPEDRGGLGKKLLSDPELFADWAPELKELIRVACEEEHDPECPASMKPLYMLTPGQKWEHVSGVTLVGDAAHLMTPFAGEGVNLAMLDALELAKSIIAASEKGEGVDGAVKAYEEEMFARAEEKMTETWENLKIIFADGLEGIVKVVESHGPPPEE